MNIFQKLSFVSKILKAINAVKTVLNHPHTIEVENRITGGINKIAEGLNDIKKEVPEANEVADTIREALQNANILSDNVEE